MATRPLSEVAKTIRSKNAGVDRITFDVIFAERVDYQRVRDSGALSRAAVCRIFNIADSRITDYVEFDPALAIKFTIARSITSGSPGDADIFGSQQYGPLLGVEVPAG
jgi:limonene-1,2-epoxide hydrolase